MLLALVKTPTSKGMMHGKLLTPAHVRHREATTPNKKRTSDPTKVGAEARCMSYAIEAGRRRPEAPFTKARRRCRNAQLNFYIIKSNFSELVVVKIIFTIIDANKLSHWVFIETLGFKLLLQKCLGIFFRVYL